MAFKSSAYQKSRRTASIDFWVPSSIFDFRRALLIFTSIAWADGVQISMIDVVRIDSDVHFWIPWVNVFDLILPFQYLLSAWKSAFHHIRSIFTCSRCWTEVNSAKVRVYQMLLVGVEVRQVAVTQCWPSPPLLEGDYQNLVASTLDGVAWFRNYIWIYRIATKVSTFSSSLDSNWWDEQSPSKHHCGHRYSSNHTDLSSLVIQSARMICYGVLSNRWCAYWTHISSVLQ